MSAESGEVMVCCNNEQIMMLISLLHSCQKASAKVTGKYGQHASGVILVVSPENYSGRICISCSFLLTVQSYKSVDKRKVAVEQEQSYGQRPRIIGAPYVADLMKIHHLTEVVQMSLRLASSSSVQM
jgi:hypothetical protein